MSLSSLFFVTTGKGFYAGKRKDMELLPLLILISLWASAMRYIVERLLLVNYEFILTSDLRRDLSNLNFVFAAFDGNMCSSTY